MAGKYGHAGVAGVETVTLIGTDRRDSYIITISKLFTFLYLSYLREVVNVSVDIRCLCARYGVLFY